MGFNALFIWVSLIHFSHGHFTSHQFKGAPYFIPPLMKKKLMKAAVIPTAKMPYPIMHQLSINQILTQIYDGEASNSCRTSISNAFNQMGYRFQVSLHLPTLNSTSFSSVSMCFFHLSFCRYTRYKLQAPSFKLMITQNKIIHIPLTLKCT